MARLEQVLSGRGRGSPPESGGGRDTGASRQNKPAQSLPARY